MYGVITCCDNDVSLAREHVKIDGSRTKPALPRPRRHKLLAAAWESRSFLHAFGFSRISRSMKLRPSKLVDAVEIGGFAQKVRGPAIGDCSTVLQSRYLQHLRTPHGLAKGGNSTERWLSLSRCCRGTFLHLVIVSVHMHFELEISTRAPKNIP